MLNGFYFDRLDDKQKGAFNLLLSGISDGQRLVYVNDTFGGAEAEQIIHAVQHENPYLYKCVFQLVEYRVADRPTFIFRYVNVDSEAYERAFADVIDRISSRLKSNSSDYEICVAVHNVIAETVTADTDISDALARADAFGQDSPERENVIAEILENGHAASFTPYGVIVNKRAVCMGVASAVKLILDRFGVQCAVATGSARNGARHMWNVVEIEGERYNLDVTSDLRLKNFDFTRYGGCLVPDSLYSRNFTSDNEFGCNSLKNSYFVQSGACFADLQAMVNYLEQVNFEGQRGTIAFLYIGALKDDYLEKFVAKILYGRLKDYEIYPAGPDGGLFQCGVRRK